MFLIELEEKKTLLKKLLKINFNISQFDKNYTYYNKETGVYVEDLIEIEYCNRTYVTVMYMKITNNILKIKSIDLENHLRVLDGD
jgi:hypothetical protein